MKISIYYNYTELNSNLPLNATNQTGAYQSTVVTDRLDQVNDIIRLYHHPNDTNIPLWLLMNINDAKFNIMHYIFQLVTILLLLFIITLLLIYWKKIRNLVVVHRKADDQLKKSNPSLDNHPLAYEDIDLGRELMVYHLHPQINNNDLKNNSNTFYSTSSSFP